MYRLTGGLLTMYSLYSSLSEQGRQAAWQDHGATGTSSLTCAGCEAAQEAETRHNSSASAKRGLSTMR